MEDYNGRLTGEPFLYVESKIIAEYMLEGYAAEELKIKNIEENLIKHKTVGSIKRTNSPVFRRLGVLDNELLKEFVYADLETSKYILLYSIMKTDRLVRDFIFEVYKDKLYMRRDFIDNYDIETWYEEKRAMSKVLNERSDSTSYKMKQVLMKIVQDSGLVRKEKNIYKIEKPLLKEKFIAMLNERGDYEYVKAIGGLI